MKRLHSPKSRAWSALAVAEKTLDALAARGLETYEEPRAALNAARRSLRRSTWTRYASDVDTALANRLNWLGRSSVGIGAEAKRLQWFDLTMANLAAYVLGAADSLVGSTKLTRSISNENIESALDYAVRLWEALEPDPGAARHIVDNLFAVELLKRP